MKFGNGRYLVYASGIAIVVTAIVQGLFTAATGLAMSSTIPGMLVSVALFGVIMFAVLGYFGKKITTNVDQLIALYDHQCDPQAFVVSAQPLAESFPVPYDRRASWFMSYFAQAMLDLGEVQKAQRIEQNMYESVRKSDALETQIQVIVNLIPLINKVLGPADAVPVIQKGLELLDASDEVNDAHRFRAYLQDQLLLAQSVVDDNVEQLLLFYSTARKNSLLPLRIRNEQAWEEAKLHYRLGNIALEKECLEFIVEFGNNLALVKPAKERLSSIA